MGISARIRTARIASWVCLVVCVVILGRMIPLGLSGEAGKVKVYFALFLIAAIIGIIATLLYYYWKSKIQTYDLAANMEMKTLEQTGQQIREEEKTKPEIHD
jgi:cytochrome bd-type quinol oxidase subunit 2